MDVSGQLQVPAALPPVIYFGNSIIYQLTGADSQLQKTNSTSSSARLAKRVQLLR